jgi:hypothetical protein
MKKTILFIMTVPISLLISLQICAQCPVKKVASQYGFFRVTDFEEKICWLSEPFGYEVQNGSIADYEALSKCFIKKVEALGGNITNGTRIVWLNNTYNAADELESSYNFGLPSAEACLKYIKGEVQYKTHVGIEVKIVKMFTNGIASL